MYWPEIKQFFRPKERILADESLPEYDRRMKYAKAVQLEKDALRARHQSTLGPDYRPLSVSSRLYLKVHFKRKDLERSLISKIWTGLMSKVWLGRLWLSKQIQYTKYVSSSGSRKITLVMLFVLGMYMGDFKSYFEYAPGHVPYAMQMLAMQRYHWVTPFIVEDTYYKYKPDVYRKDFLEQGMDRLISEGLEMGETDSLNWLTLGSLYHLQREPEFAYLCMQMAHYKNHQVLGGNSLQPIESTDATRFFTR